jgi:hypothetical protein
MFEFDTRDFDRYFKLISKAAHGEFKKQIALWFEASGFEFLRVVQDEIIRRKVVNTRLLLNSFEKGEKHNVWKVSDGGLTLEVGTNVSYAAYVNDGHWTNKKGQKSRFVPGVWRGDNFEYVRGAKTGMVLKQKWVEGAHYWEAAIRIFERIFKTSVEKKMAEWRDKYFK